MGAYFANLHVKKTNADEAHLRALVTEHYTSKGYIPTSPDTANMEISLYAPENSDWVSIYSDAFTHTDILDLAPQLSQTCETEILSVACFDSDYLFVNLLHTEKAIDLWLNIGDTQEIKKPRRSGVAAWKGHVADHARFKTAAGQTYTCAEDFLREAQDDLGISFEQCTGADLPATITTLCFSSPHIKDDLPTKLTHWKSSSDHCQPGQRFSCAVFNQGQSSKGICALFVGDYVVPEEITIDDAQFFYQDRNGKSVTIPITFKKMQWTDTLWVYHWEDADFCIPPAVPTNLPPRTQVKKQGERNFGISFVPNGNKRKFLDITVVLAPLSNFESGQYAWCAWGGYASKREYIREKNRWAAQMRKFGAPEEAIAEFLINESDYDLD